MPESSKKISRLEILLKLIVIPAFFLTGLLTGCQQKQQTELAENQYFKNILDSANHLYNSGKSPKAIALLDETLPKNKDISIADHFEFLRLHCAYYFHEKRDYDKTMLFADSMFAIIARSKVPQKYSPQYAIACFSKGDAYFGMQKYTEAFRFYYIGKLTGKNSFDNCTLGDYSYRMGMIKYKQEHFDQATEYFKQSFAEKTACSNSFSNFYRGQEILDNIGLCYKKMKNFGQAENYFNEALLFISAGEKKYTDYFKQIEVAKGVIYGNYADIFLHQRKLSKAKILLKKSIQINIDKSNDYKDAQLSELKLAHIYFEAGNTDSLLVLMKKIDLQLDTVKNDVAEIDWNFLMASYYQSEKNYKKALTFFTRYDLVKDSLNVNNAAIKAYDENKEFKAIDDEREINAQKKREQKEHFYLAVEGIVSLMAFFIIILIFQNWKRSKTNVTTLSNLNNKINEQNETLQKAFSDLEARDKEKDRILHAVAHDLRNPIGGIASLTALMIDDADVSIEQMELVKLIQTATQNSLELINEILEATGTLSGKITKRQLVDINTLLSNSIELLRFKAAEKNQRIMLQVLEQPQELLISREKIWRVVSNLISNAIKFSPNNSIINVTISEQKDDVQIEVTDNGIGIPDKMKNLVFNMFTEAKRPGTNGEKSFGLGLSISKQIVESHGGQIWFDRIPKGGTIFYVKLKKHKSII